MKSCIARYVADRGAYVVPTMSVIFATMEVGVRMGTPPENLEKFKIAREMAIAGLDHMRSAGVKVGYGTDLLGSTYDQQCREFDLRAEVFTPLELLRQATSMGAEILMEDGDLGCVKVGAYADLIVVDGDPLTDIGLLAASGRSLDLIMRGGEIIKNRLCWRGPARSSRWLRKRHQHPAPREFPRHREGSAKSESIATPPAE